MCIITPDFYIVAEDLNLGLCIYAASALQTELWLLVLIRSLGFQCFLEHVTISCFHVTCDHNICQ